MLKTLSVWKIVTRNLREQEKKFPTRNEFNSYLFTAALPSLVQSCNFAMCHGKTACQTSTLPPGLATFRGQRMTNPFSSSVSALLIVSKKAVKTFDRSHDSASSRPVPLSNKPTVKRSPQPMIWIPRRDLVVANRSPHDFHPKRENSNVFRENQNAITQRTKGFKKINCLHLCHWRHVALIMQHKLFVLCGVVKLFISWHFPFLHPASLESELHRKGCYTLLKILSRGGLCAAVRINMFLEVYWQPRGDRA